MEAAVPIMSTPKDIEDKDLKMIDIKSYDLNINNKLYKLDLAKTDDKAYIIFKVYESNKLIKKYNILHQNIETFHLNILFRLYPTIDDIYCLLLDVLNSKKYYIKQNKDSITLIMIFSMPGGKSIDVPFELKEKIPKSDDLISKLYGIIDDLLKENTEIKEDLKNKEEELDRVKKKLKFLSDENAKINNRLSIIETYIDKKNDEEKEMLFDLEKSDIIKKKKDKIKLKEWITVNGRIKQINLLYKASVDGDTCESFFNKCGNKGATISVIKSSKGKIFGGYTKAEWTDKKGVLRLYDNTAFLYSLDNMEKYNILKPELAICCYPGDNCIVYGNNSDNNGICLRPNFLTKINLESHGSRVYDVPQNCYLSGEKMFTIEDVEVYQIIFY
jgi:hypothetical protein